MSTANFDQLVRLVRAGAGVIHIASYEWERVRGWCIGLAGELDLCLQIWSSSSGLLDCDERGQTKPNEDGLDDPIEVMRALRENSEGGIVLLEDIHPFINEHHQVTRWVREMCRQRVWISH